VFACRDDRGNDRVLKLPKTEREATTEAAALRAWCGKGAVRLIDFDAELAALLPVRLVPGTPLVVADDDGLEAVAGVLRALHRADLLDVNVPSMQVAFDQYLTQTTADAEDGTAGLALLGASRATAMALCTSMHQPVLLHGDLLDKNLLLDGTRFVAVDPIPRIGDPCADIGFFAAGQPPCSRITDQAERLARLLGHDPMRAARWAAIWAVGEACETWRRDSDDLQDWVTGPEATALLAT